MYRSSQVFVNGQEVGPDGIAEAERLSGFDLDGDGRIAGGPAAGQSLQAMIDGAMASMATVAGAADDAGLGPDARVALLERLAALRDGGAITPAEFEAEKAKILGA